MARIDTRLYILQSVDGAVYRRNRVHIRPSTNNHTILRNLDYKMIQTPSRVVKPSLTTEPKQIVSESSSKEKEGITYEKPCTQAYDRPKRQTKNRPISKTMFAEHIYTLLFVRSNTRTLV